ncbi:DUF5696 domain-containing protein [Anaerocolumna sp. AGMB13025]|uniref:DUF5696 domain-containing protein n=1 Tax=Anaerocolumna sp. AGMB13025 TaxID=3039116 RepID=UPI00241C0276|nr:DUF5696 domain-containing protein [Anaerocolumna sp. AGMB13025]WFR60071.1 DUF5696 domain-containing protein [Anaerocolumna sp. AGMB13025]
MKRLTIIGLALFSAFTLLACSATAPEDKAMDTHSYAEENKSYTLEDDKLKLTLDGNNTYFQLLNKVNNSVWDSNPFDGAKDTTANAQNIKYLQSTFIIEYTNETGITTILDNFSYSIQKKFYTIEHGDDYIRVNYTVGDVQKAYLLPEAAPESRMKEFTDKMDSSSQKKINTYYRKIDINNLRATDDPGKLLAAYPDLEKENVFVLREGTQEYLKKNIEKLFEKAGYTREDYEVDAARYSGTNTTEKPYFNISVEYRLEDGDLVVSLPFESMEWKKNYPLTKVKVLPYLGAGSTEDEGFILVPEGNGGIINFNNGKKTQNSYFTEIYGIDSAVPRDSLISENRTSLPVFGIARNGSSMLCMLEDYQTLASIEADVSGRNHNYNYADVSYTTIHYASLNVSAKTDKSVIVYEAQKPEGDIRQRYRFLTTDSYSDMAAAYRDYLIKKHPELTKKEEIGIPVNITLIGAVDQIKQRLGYPVSVPVALTDYKEATQILQQLKTSGMKNLSLRYNGWMNGGIKQTIPEPVKALKVLGSKGDFQSFLKAATELNVPVYLEGMASYAYDNGLFDNFSPNRQGAKFASREVAKLYDFSPVYFGLEDEKDPYYLLKPQLTARYMRTIGDYAANYKINVAFSDIGFRLNADYNPKNLTTREKSMKLQIDALANIAAKGTKIMVNGGNAYTLPYASFISDMDLTGEQYQIIDYMVPFYAIALHGLIDYTGSSLNLSGDYQQLLLKSAEYGAGLSFTFMKEAATKLQNSNYTYLFGADYDRWKENAMSIYQRYEKELGFCFNQYITKHQPLAEGVYITTYEDGTRVYVNYNNTEYTDGTIKVPARDYLVERR